MIARCRTAATLVILIVAAAALAAHDLWIEPSVFVVPTGKPVAIRLRVGANLLGDPVARDKELIDRFISVDASGETPVPGPDGVDPAGIVRIAAPGLTIVGYSSKPSRVSLPAQKFNDYLAEEGLESIAASRAKRNESQAEAREEFSRCAKTLISSGVVAKSGDRALGFTLELIAERNPYAMRAGEPLPVRLLYKGQPLSGTLVVALNKRDPSQKVSARSGKDGRVSLMLKDPGMWLVKAVHMIPSPAGADAQWSSFWASLTFELPGAPATASRQR
ncbi:MAG: DUF4198 domain-containing protein [Vicinamibacterales bacterium]